MNETTYELTPGAVLTVERAESSYGIPVLVFDGSAYGPSDLLPFNKTAGRWVCDVVSGGFKTWWDEAVTRHPILGQFTSFQA